MGAFSFYIHSSSRSRLAKNLLLSRFAAAVAAGSLDATQVD
jgi:hypothetical protein